MAFTPSYLRLVEFRKIHDPITSLPLLYRYVLGLWFGEKSAPVQNRTFSADIGINNTSIPVLYIPVHALGIGRVHPRLSDYPNPRLSEQDMHGI